MRIPSGTTDQVIYFVALDSLDLKSRETGLSAFTVYRDRNGAGAAAMTTPTVTEVDATNMPGLYKLLLDEDMTISSGNDSEEMAFHITHAGMAPVTRVIELYRRPVSSGCTLSVESDGDLTKVNTLDGHTAQTGDVFALADGDHGFVSIQDDVDAILEDTGTTLPATLTTIAGYLDTEIAAILADTGTDGVVLSAATANQIADAILKRDWSSVTGEAARSVLNALRILRNKVSESGGTLTVTKEDDAATAWTAAVTTDAAAHPITEIDPA